MAKVELVHVTSPLCHWSWGYEPVINRLEMLYGRQIQLTVALGVPYTDRAKWLEDYEMTSDEAIAFTSEVVAAGGLPVALPRSWGEMPESTLPSVIAVKAAGIVHGPKAERKLTRAIMYAQFVEGKDASQDKVLAEAVEKCGFDNERMVEAATGDAIDEAMAEDMRRVGHGGNFYSLFVRDGKGTNIAMERAYDPVPVEKAVEFLAGRKLARGKLATPTHYIREHGPVPLEELRRVYGWDATKAKAQVAKLEKAGEIRRAATPLLPRARFYEAVTRG